MSEWISVNEKLPETRKLVLLCVQSPQPSGLLWRGIVSGYFDNSTGWQFPVADLENISVMFWMDCPDFPDDMKNECEKCN